eukprot:5255438-Prymnesium_polylepis.2
MLVALADVHLAALAALRLGEGVPSRLADLLLAGRNRRLGDEPLARARRIARSDGLGRRSTRQRPAALAVHLLVLRLPLDQQPPGVREDLPVDRPRDGGRRAARRESRAAHHDVDDLAVGRLDLRVGREEPEAELGRLVPAEGDDPLADRHAERRDRLARDGELAAHGLDRALAGQRRDIDRRARGQRLQAVGDVGVDCTRRHAARELRPDKHAQKARQRLETPAVVSPRAPPPALARLVVRLVLGLAL